MPYFRTGDLTRRTQFHTVSEMGAYSVQKAIVLRTVGQGQPFLRFFSDPSGFLLFSTFEEIRQIIKVGTNKRCCVCCTRR